MSLKTPVGPDDLEQRSRPDLDSLARGTRRMRARKRTPPGSIANPEHPSLKLGSLARPARAADEVEQSDTSTKCA